MTTVHIDMRDAAILPINGSMVVTFVPTKRLNASDHIVLPLPVRVTLAAGVGTVSLTPTDGSTYPGLWAWKCTEYGNGDQHVRYVLVPTGTTLEYSALSEVDPTTLDPADDPEPAWWTAFNGHNHTHGPAPVVLTDAASIATDASLSTQFRVTLGGNRTLAAPTNPVDGQRLLWELIQDATGSRTLTLATGAGGFRFGADLTGISLSSTPGKRDYLGAIYCAADTRWDVIAFAKGY